MTRPPSDDQIDEALKGTFPASDPPGFTVETGIRLVMEPAPVSDIVLRDHREASRFEAVVDGAVAYLAYERGPKAFVLLHTEVPGSLRGKGASARRSSARLGAASFSRSIWPRAPASCAA